MLGKVLLLDKVGDVAADHAVHKAVSKHRRQSLKRASRQTLKPLAAMHVSGPAQTLPGLVPSRHALHDRRFNMSYEVMTTCRHQHSLMCLQHSSCGPHSMRQASRKILRGSMPLYICQNSQSKQAQGNLSGRAVTSGNTALIRRNKISIMYTCGMLLPLRRSVRPSMTCTWLGRTCGSHFASSSAHARRRLAGTTTNRGHWSCSSRE